MPDDQSPEPAPCASDAHGINRPEHEDGPDRNTDEQTERSHIMLSHPEEQLRLIEENVRDCAIIMAAAHTAQIKFALRAFVREYLQLAVAMEWLNAFLYEAERLDDSVDDTETRFTVLCLGIIDPSSGEMEFAGAGIEPPLIVRAGGETVSVKTSGVPVERAREFGGGVFRDDGCLLQARRN